jgi:hypothetical protein
VEEIVTFRGLPPASDEELSRTAGDLRRALEKKAARPRAAPAPTRKSRRIVTSTATTAGPP